MKMIRSMDGPLEQFEELGAAMKRAHEAAKSGQVDDATRRARAAELALRLAASLGLEEEDTDEPAKTRDPPAAPDTNA